jgi:hypothetical protein
MPQEESQDPKRRAVLKKTGAAVAAGAIIPGAAAANPGNGKGNGPGEGKGNGPDEGKRNGPGGGPPFEEPKTENVVFCGCSQVCICQAQCCSAYVFVEGGDNISLDGEVPTCVEVEEGRIVAVADTGFDDGDPIFEGAPGLYCNPNTAGGGCDALRWDGIDRDLTPERDCTWGTAPQFGTRCGDAFLDDCPGCDSSPVSLP